MASSRSATTTEVERVSLDELLRDWPEGPRSTVRQMVQKYGPPDEASKSQVTWHNNGPWKRTIVHREEVPHDFPKSHQDHLEQVINYQVPPEKFDDLAEFDGSVYPDRTAGEIAAKCDREAANFVALNLAHDIIEGNKSVSQARKEYAENIKSVMEQQPKPYAQGLTFRPGMGRTGDPDKSIMG